MKLLLNNPERINTQPLRDYAHNEEKSELHS